MKQQALLLAAMLASSVVCAQERTERITLDQGSASVRGAVKGNDSVQYQLETAPHQQLTVQLSTSNPSNYFNVERGGVAEAICQGALTGNVCSFRTEPGVSYVVDVFMMRNAARRGESAQYTLSIAQAGAQPAPAAQAPPPSADKEASASAVAACKSALALRSGKNAVFVLPLSHVPALGGYEVFLSLDGAQWLCMTDARGNVNRLDRR